MLIAGATLALYFHVIGFRSEWRRWWRQYAIVGLLTSAVPFLLYAYAALSITAGLMSVLNASSPMWGALFSAWLLDDRLSARGIAGLAIGIVGVGLVTLPEIGTGFAVFPAIAATGAAACYGLAGAYMRRWANDVPSRGMALGTQIAGGLMMAPLLAFAPPAAMPTPLVVASVLAMGIVCGAVAYVLYFRLVTDIGAAGALTVTYLIPLFGVAFGALFLGEVISLLMLGGGALVLLGTFLVLRK
jgi:drug/metabolite transporter (DMT)-like permease